MLTSPKRDPRVWLAATTLTMVLLAVGLRWAGLAGGWWHGADRAILLVLRDTTDPGRPIGPEWLRGAVIAFTALGSAKVLIPTTVAAAASLVARRHWRHALLLLAATASGGEAVNLLKLTVSRARPDIVAHLIEVRSLSFPSAHAADSMLVYLSIAALATHGLRPAARHATLTVAALLALLLGLSRLYLGVHWPTDVAAGWLFGLGWAMAWWAAGERLAPPHPPQAVHG